MANCSKMKQKWKISWRTCARRNGICSKTPGEVLQKLSAALKLVHPHRADMIDAWVERFDEMMAGPIAVLLIFWPSCGSGKFPSMP